MRARLLTWYPFTIADDLAPLHDIQHHTQKQPNPIKAMRAGRTPDQQVHDGGVERDNDPQQRYDNIVLPDKIPSAAENPGQDQYQAGRNGRYNRK